MKRVFNKDGSVDLKFTTKEFDSYIVGCMVKKDDNETIVRVRGIVDDLSKVVLQKRR